ncbi:MAG TPA: DUF721 domain-containing protein [Vicinamibacteria bacterium]|jgi:hypothetical protein
MRFERAGEGDLAARLFGRDRAHVTELLRAAWAPAVGADLARRTEVVGVEGETLRVRVPDARWRTVLHRMQPQILARLRDVAGTLAPRRLGFVEGTLATPPSPRLHAPHPPADADCPPAVADEAARIADAELRERFLAAAGRYLSRAPGRDAR